MLPRHRRSSGTLRLRIAVLLSLLACPPAWAIFHIARVNEVMSGVGGNAIVQYVEIRMLSGFQNSVSNTRLTWFDCTFSACQVLMQVPFNVANSGNGVTWLMASPDDATFSAATGTHAEFYWNNATSGNIDRTCGMVCWGAPGVVAPDPATWDPGDPNNYTDCVAYGGYTGRTKTVAAYAGGPTSGPPNPNLAGNGTTMSLTRVNDTNNNANDFSLAAMTPTNNGAGNLPTQTPNPCTQAANNCPCTPLTPTTSTVQTTTSTLRPTTTTMPAGTPLRISGKKLLLKDDPADPVKRKLVVVSHDASIDLGAENGSPDDPTLGGGSLRVRTTSGCGASGTQACDDTYNLPTGSWKLIGKVGQNKGYIYKDPALANGPILNATVKGGKAHAVIVTGKGSGLGDAVGSDPKPVDIILKLGAKPYCMHFGGTEKLKVGKKATFQNAPEPGACPP